MLVEETDRQLKCRASYLVFHGLFSIIFCFLYWRFLFSRLGEIVHGETVWSYSHFILVNLALIIFWKRKNGKKEKKSFGQNALDQSEDLAGWRD